MLLGKVLVRKVLDNSFMSHHFQCTPHFQISGHWHRATNQSCRCPDAAKQLFGWEKGDILRVGIFGDVKHSHSIIWKSWQGLFFSCFKCYFDLFHEKNTMIKLFEHNNCHNGNKEKKSQILNCIFRNTCLWGLFKLKVNAFGNRRPTVTIWLKVCPFIIAIMIFPVL